MIAPPLSVNEPLWRSSRLAAGAAVRQMTLWQDALICLLSGIGAAACVHLLDFSLRIPGHAILRSILPVTLGMALSPRRLAGTLIGASALGTTAVLNARGVEIAGWGALTSLLLIGPMLDAALWQTKPGWRILLRCAAAGFLTNLVAFGIRGGKKFAGWDAIKMRPFSDWLSTAAITYTLCGLVAGLLAGLLWFRWTPRQPDGPREAAA